VPGLLLDPRPAQRAPGRPQTARLACPWRPRLPADGRRAGAWRPADQVGVRRGSRRHRPRRRTSAAHPLPHMPTAVPQMPRPRTPVVRARPGVTGMASIQALSAGERHPQPLAQLRHPPGHHDDDDRAQALQGPGRAEPLWA
jgi:hypothetical protein